MKTKTKTILRRSCYAILLVSLLLAVGAYGAYEYAKARLFKDTPNTLVFQSELHTVPFEWAAEKFEDYVEPHSAILIPVSIPGFPNRFYMQFDTGSPDTFLHSGALDSLESHGLDFELINKDNLHYIKQFDFDIAGNRVSLESGWVMGRKTSIDWDDPNAKNVIGSFGADFLDQKICEIDFPAKTIRFSEERSEALNSLGEFAPFDFKGRRIMLPAIVDGEEVQVFYDSGCSAFGLLTSKYYYDRLTKSTEPEIIYNANRHGDPVLIHHRASGMQIYIGSTEMSVDRISYAELYTFLQSTIGRIIGGGFLGNKSLIDRTMVLDTKSNEFLIVNHSLLTPRSEPSPDAKPGDASTGQDPDLPMEIPFELTEHNNIVIDAILDGKHRLDLMFHTAVDSVSLTQQKLEELPDIELDQEGDSESWGGTSTIRFASGFKLSLGDVNLDDVTIFQSMQSGHQTDGKFGPPQLKSRFIEIDFDHSKLLLHDSLPEKISDWQKSEITLENGIMFVEGNIHNGENVIQQRFMLHSGYSGFALLDDQFVSKHDYINELEIIKESELTDSGGNKLKTKKSTLPLFSIAESEFNDVPVSFFSGAIGRQKFSVLGGDFLKRFNLLFDLENKTLYLKKSRLFDSAHDEEPHQ